MQNASTGGRGSVGNDYKADDSKPNSQVEIITSCNQAKEKEDNGPSMQNASMNVAIDRGQVSNDLKAGNSKHSNHRVEVFRSSSNQAKEDNDRSGKGEVTSSMAANAAATLRALASQTLNMTAPEAIAHIQQVLQVPYNVVRSLVSEVAHEVIVKAQAIQNITEAMDSIENRKTNSNSEEILNNQQTKNMEKTKTKSQKPKIHKCPQCHKMFCNAFNLSRHRQRHIIQTKCTQCDKVYLFPLRLIAHIKTHQMSTEKVKDVLCPECGKGFYNHAKMRMHLRIHGGERPFPCAFCGKRFLTPSNRKRHERLHTGEHPFVCETCGKGFGSPSHLKDHTYTHTKENPYPCNICGKGFTQWGAMMRHVGAIHEKKEGVKCPHCTKSFSRKYYLKIHIQKYHSIMCPSCKHFFESDKVFEKHEAECTGLSSTSQMSNTRYSAKCKLPPSPALVARVSLRNRSSPVDLAQLLSFYEEFEDDSMSDPNYEAEEGEDEEMVEEVLEEGEMDEFKVREGVGLDQEEILVQERQEEQILKQ